MGFFPTWDFVLTGFFPRTVQIHSKYALHHFFVYFIIIIIDVYHVFIITSFIHYFLNLTVSSQELIFDNHIAISETNCHIF